VDSDISMKPKKFSKPAASKYQKKEGETLCAWRVYLVTGGKEGKRALLAKGERHEEPRLLKGPNEKAMNTKPKKGVRRRCFHEIGEKVPDQSEIRSNEGVLGRNLEEKRRRAGHGG